MPRSTGRLSQLVVVPDSSHFAEVPAASSDNVFAFNSDDDDDDGRVVPSPAKRKRDTGSARGRGNKKAANGKAASPRPPSGTSMHLTSIVGLKGSRAARGKSRVAASATAAASTAVDNAEHVMANSSDGAPSVSPESATQLEARAMEAVRQSHISSGSGAGAGRNDEAMDTIGAKSGNTTTADPSRGDGSMPNRRVVAGAPTPAISGPPASSVSLPTRRRNSVRAAAGAGAAAVLSPVQGTGAAAAAPQANLSWPSLWSFLRDREGWTSANGRGLVTFVYCMPAQDEAHPSRTFTTTHETCEYVERKSDLLARYRAYEAGGWVERSEGSAAGGSSASGRSAPRRNASRIETTRSGSGAEVNIPASDEAEVDTDEANGDAHQESNGASDRHRDAPAVFDLVCSTRLAVRRTLFLSLFCLFLNKHPTFVVAHKYMCLQISQCSCSERNEQREQRRGHAQVALFCVAHR